jgi:hypothetical protein
MVTNEIKDNCEIFRILKKKSQIVVPVNRRDAYEEDAKIVELSRFTKKARIFI